MRLLPSLLILSATAGCGHTSPPPLATRIRVDTLITANLASIELPIAAHVLPSGLIAVLDYRAGHVILLDSTGSIQATYGRPGKGPGEFLMATDFTVLADTIAVHDLGNGRLTNFLPDKGFVGTRRLPRGFTHQAFVLLPGDTTLHMTDGVDSALAVLRSPSGDVLVRFGTPIAPPTTFFYLGRMKEAAAAGRVPDELKNVVLPILAPERDVWVLQQATGRVEHFDPTGRLLGALSLPPAHIADRTEAFFQASRAVASDPARMGGIAMAFGGQATAGRLWLLLAEPDSVPAKLLLIDTSYTIRHTYQLPDIAGVSTLTVDPRSGAFLMLNRGEGILMRITVVVDSAA